VEVLDFLGVISCGRDLDEALRQLLRVLVDMAETTPLAQLSLPLPNPSATNPEADLEEPIHLVLSAAAQERVAPVAAPT
jgi:hypothetical protein